MMKPEECKFMEKAWNIKCECKVVEFPSYFEKVNEEYKPEGCLVAHTVLALLETSNIEHRILNVISRVLKVLRGSEKVNPLNVLYATILLHDIGKIDREYREFRKPGHNVISAWITEKILEGLFPESIVFTSALSIFLHHEAYHWMELASTPLIDILTLTKPIRVKVHPDDVNRFLSLIVRNCCSVRGDICRIARSLAENAVAIRDYGYRIPLDFISETYSKIRTKRGLDARMKLRPITVLYRILHVVDCRAASVRECENKYWACRDNTWMSKSLIPEKQLNVCKKQRT